jgi:hypothetical protein
MVLVGAAHVVHADEFATSPLRAGYQPSDKRLLDSAWRARWEDRGLRWDATYAMEAFAAPQLERAIVAAGLFIAELELDGAKLVHGGLGQAHVAAFAIHGDGLSDELMDIHGISGNVAGDDVRLFEAWYEQPIGVVTLRGGLLAADQEYVIADHASTLLGATFGMTSQFSANVGGPVYPVATPGLSARIETTHVVGRAAVYDGTQSNVRGVPTDLGPAWLVMSEVELFDTVELGAWRHSERGAGYYAIVDAHIDDRTGAFARLGISPGKAVDTYIDAGVRVVPGASRPDDFVCAGLAFARTEQGAQIAIEASYEAQVRWLTIQPDLQLVMLHDRTVAVAATRVTLVF